MRLIFDPKGSALLIRGVVWGITVESGNPAYHSAGNCLIETATKTLVLGCDFSSIPTDGSVTSIGDYAFANCIWLKSIAIPNGVTRIGAYAFVGCTGLTSITIPKSARSIGYGAFEYCHGLTNVTIEGSVTRIDYDAFHGCRGLTSVTIPDSMEAVLKYLSQKEVKK